MEGAQLWAKAQLYKMIQKIMAIDCLMKAQ
jgi:hypothetical protein